MTRRLILQLGAVLATGAVVLTGCSQKQEASHTLPTSSAAARTTPGLPPQGPEAFPVPAEAREKSPEGALAFAKYFIALGTKVGQGGAPSQALLDLSTPECRLCGQVVASFAADEAAGYKHVGSSSTFKEYAPPRLSGDSAEVGFVYSQSAYTVVDGSGQQVPDRAVAATGDLQSGMELEWRDDLTSWLVTSLTIG